MSARELSLNAGLSPSVVQLIEDQRRLPGLDTVERLAAALSVSTPWLAFGTGPQSRSEVSYYVEPGHDSIGMVRELASLLTGPGGHIEQSYKYLDAADADNWCELTQQDRYGGFSESKPLEQVAAAVLQQIGRTGLDVIGLGVGTGTHEARLIDKLLDGGYADLRLFLVDISQPLLSLACQQTTKMLSGHAHIPITAINGNFFHLPSYEEVFQTTHRRQRLLTLFGNTLGNLDNEIRFIRNSLSGAQRGDLFLIDVGVAKAPAERVDLLTANEPVLGKTRSPELQKQLKLQERFNVGPLLRYRNDIAEFEYMYSLDTTSCVIPGSYAIHMSANTRLTNGGSCQFSLGYIKRYDIAKLAERLKTEGWGHVGSWEYKGQALGLFVRT